MSLQELGQIHQYGQVEKIEDTTPWDRLLLDQEPPRRYRDEQEIDLEEGLSGDPLTEIHYVSFVSRSKGRSRGRFRARSDSPVRREMWVDVELIGYNGSFFQVTDGDDRLDVIAREVLGNHEIYDHPGDLLLQKLRWKDAHRRSKQGC